MSSSLPASRPPELTTERHPARDLWVGWILTGIAVSFLFFDIALKMP